MTTISLCMIVKNEEKTIGRCLSSCRSIVDEIIIVDTGSTDKTKDIAAKYTDRIYDFVWCDDFSAARNYAYDKATKDYILWLDADDIFLVEDMKKILDLKERLPDDVDTVMLKYNTGFDQFGNVTFSYYRERLTRRSCGFRWHEPVHEYLETGGKLICLDAAVTHAKPADIERAEPSKRNLRIYESLLKQGKELTARGLYYYARELKDHKRYNDALNYFDKFLNSGKGWGEDCISACREMAHCHLALGDLDKVLGDLFRSFLYDIPRSETCCLIGYYYMDRQDYVKAISWFEVAVTVKQPENSWGFSQPDCRGFVPYIECAVCYDRLGNIDKAIEYNELAALFKPESYKVVFNRRYFQQLKDAASLVKPKGQEDPTM